MQSIQIVTVSVQEIRTERKKNNLMTWLRMDSSKFTTGDNRSCEWGIKKSGKENYKGIFVIPVSARRHRLGPWYFLSEHGQSMVLITPGLWVWSLYGPSTAELGSMSFWVPFNSEYSVIIETYLKWFFHWFRNHRDSTTTFQCILNSNPPYRWEEFCNADFKHTTEMSWKISIYKA